MENVQKADFAEKICKNAKSVLKKCTMSAEKQLKTAKIVLNLQTVGSAKEKEIAAPAQSPEKKSSRLN